MLDMLDSLIVRELVALLPRSERRVAELLMQGHSQTGAARKLRITARTARRRMRKIRRRMAA